LTTDDDDFILIQYWHLEKEETKMFEREDNFFGQAIPHPLIDPSLLGSDLRKNSTIDSFTRPTTTCELESEP
jgi:hypothetical protein